jgi:integration host factor subunit beta
MKSSIVEQMRRDDPDMSALEAGRTFDLVTNALVAVINREGEARIPGLGKFEKRFQQGRQGRNPRTGEPVEIAGRDVIKFKATKPSKR